MFDVFGTVVDWRGSIIRELTRVSAAGIGVRADWGAFADAWRAGYRPAMDRVRRGELAVAARIDELHLDDFDAARSRRVGLRLCARGSTRAQPGLASAQRLAATARAACARLKRRFLIGTLSNGNMSLLIDLARAGRLPWDVHPVGRALSGTTSPDPEVYLGAAALLALDPREVDAGRRAQGRSRGRAALRFADRVRAPAAGAFGRASARCRARDRR